MLFRSYYDPRNALPATVAPVETFIMKAAFIDAPGPAEVIRFDELPTPDPKEGEVRVRVGAVAVNPIDTYIRSGAVAANLPKPFIVGCDLAGTVDVVGSNVRRFKAGDRVWGSNQGLVGRQGTFAEYACVREEWLYSTPANVSDEDAAAAALTGITAHLGLFGHASLKSDETVFVNGGTGGVGSMVLQMTLAAGSKVIATVGNDEKAATCRGWGAKGLINYKTEDVAARVKELTGGQGVNVWFETYREPDFIRTVDLMASRGRIVVIAGRPARPVFPVGPFYVKGLSLFGYAMFNATADEQRRCADDINRWLSEHKLQPLIGKKMRLSETAAAHRLLEESTHTGGSELSGKIVLTP
jgi:NADPH2:quinone reductase